MIAGDASGLSARLRRYAGAGAGPLLGAAMQFALSLLLLSRLDVAGFGRFAFLIVVTQFGIGLWTALFGAPMLVATARGPGGDRDVAAIVAVARLALVPAAVVVAGFALAAGVDGAATVGFALYALLLLSRQFLRTRAMAVAMPVVAIRSDILYGAVLAAGCGVLWTLPTVSLGTAVLPLVVAALVAWLALRGLPPAGANGTVAAYRAVWRRDSRWSLLGVLSTEGTVNSHSYIVTALYGATAFAPIAASALLIRPVTVAINALVEFERARFARDLADDRIDRVTAGRRHLHLALGGVWLATLALAVALLAVAPDLIFHGKFAPSTIALGTGLWFAVALARQLHAPEGALLLAGGRFRELASISIVTAAISLAGVAAGLALGGPLWSIAGIVAGEGSYAVLLQRRATRFLRTARASLVDGPAA